MHYNIELPANPTRTFARRFNLPLWNYIVTARRPEDSSYVAELDFTFGPLYEFAAFVMPKARDVLEVFALNKRVQLTGVQVAVLAPAPVVITPVTNSGMVFDSIDCGVATDRTYTIDGGILSTATDLKAHSVVIDDPDFLGLQIDSGSLNLTQLKLRVSLAVSDEFPWYARTNRA